MKAKEFVCKDTLNELFDSSTDVEWVNGPELDKWGYFTINGKRFKIEIYAIDDIEGIWGVLYGKVDNNKIQLRPTGQSKSDASQVLGTVVNTLADFMRTEKPNVVVFSGSSAGLSRLYERMIRNLHKKVDNMGYRVEHNYEGDGSKIGLVKMKGA